MPVKSLEEKQGIKSTYNHQRYETQRRFLRFLIKNIGFTLLAKIDRVEGLENFPSKGPAIVMINHINFIDPFAVLNVAPRNIVPMAKVEVYNYPLIGIFPRIWNVIPVRREEVDRRAIRGALEVLGAGEMILMAPEGTRGPQLKQGKEGLAYIASRAGVPVIPVAIDQTVGFPAIRFTRRWKEPGGIIRFGRPFRYRADLAHPSREQLRQMIDEAMYLLAAMLTEERRGVYSDLNKATQETIEWV